MQKEGQLKNTFIIKLLFWFVRIQGLLWVTLGNVITKQAQFFKIIALAGSRLVFLRQRKKGERFYWVIDFG